MSMIWTILRGLVINIIILYPYLDRYNVELVLILLPVGMGIGEALKTFLKCLILKYKKS